MVDIATEKCTIETVNVLTPEQVAERVQVNKATVLRWIKAGRLPAVKLGHKTIRIEEADLERFLKGGKGKSGARSR